jgi:DUF1365 family protein
VKTLRQFHFGSYRCNCFHLYFIRIEFRRILCTVICRVENNYNICHLYVKPTLFESEIEIRTFSDNFFMCIVSEETRIF